MSTATLKYGYPFDEAEAKAAYEEWCCNCGPAALAFALQKKLNEVRPAIPQFAERKYTSPTMMIQALQHFNQKFNAIRAPSKIDGEFSLEQGILNMFCGPMSLVRIQWCGPWTTINTRWAATHTHWICCWRDNGNKYVFDINGGIMGFNYWDDEIVPLIVASIPRADGKWYPANVWQLEGV